MSRLTDVAEWVMLKIWTVRPYSTMLPPTWVTTCAIHSARKRLFRRTLNVWSVWATAAVMD